MPVCGRALAGAFATSLLLGVILPTVHAARTEVRSGKNPMRRVVNMLQMMLKKVEAEGEKNSELFEKFTCYCNNGQTNLGNSIQEANEKIPQLDSDIKGSEEMKKQLESEILQHKNDREEAKGAIAKATAIREKEAKSFEKESAEQKSNIAALGKAIPAIEKGLGAEFLQTGVANRLRSLVSTISVQAMSESDHDLLEAFLQGGENQQSSDSREIIGIMKQLKEEMEGDLKDMEETETKAVAEFDNLLASKKKELGMATAAIEEKTKRVGDVAVELVELEADFEDTTTSLAEDSKMLANLEKTCTTKKKEFEAEAKIRDQEKLALVDTIKMLSDDDALDLFKKTLPSASALVDVGVTDREVRTEALDVLQNTLRKRGHGRRDYRLSYLALAMRGKKAGFEKVVAMVDDMVTLLGKEQADDDTKKNYCEQQMDKAEDELKGLNGVVADLESHISESKDALKNLGEDLKALSDGLVELDKEVAAATAQRKEENAVYTENLASNNAAMQLIEMAKNRLAKFYNPKLYKAGPPAALQQVALVQQEPQSAPQEDDNDSSGDSAFIQVRAHTRLSLDDTLAELAGYGKQTQEAGGVMSMMDMLKEDIAKETQEMEVIEKDAQSDYAQMVNDAADKRHTDMKAMTQKEATRATLTGELDKIVKEKNARVEEVGEQQTFLADLHKECDWLLQNYDTRKEARANEVEALRKAKAVLSGADYSLVQTGVRHHLRRGRA